MRPVATGRVALPEMRTTSLTLKTRCHACCRAFGAVAALIFSREKRSNRTHASTTDPDARLLRKSDGQPAVPCHTRRARRNRIWLR